MRREIFKYLCKYVFIVPGSDERKIHKSISVGADCVVYDLEDSVSSNKKGTARHMVIDALEVNTIKFYLSCFCLSFMFYRLLNMEKPKKPLELML